MAKFDDSDDPLGALEPLVEAILLTPMSEDRQTSFTEFSCRLTDHFEAVAATLYAALRPFPQLAMTLGQADRMREQVRHSLESLSLLPGESAEWEGVLRTLDGIVRRYFEHTEPRLIEAAALCLGRDELQRLGAEATRIHETRTRAAKPHKARSRVRSFPVHHSETQHG